MKALRVGDVVTVGRPCMGNAPDTRAVVVEVYRLDRRDGWQLLFPNGLSDGFSPEDLVAFRVARIGHVPALAGYQFVSAMTLNWHFKRGLFAAAWQAQPLAKAEAR